MNGSTTIVQLIPISYGSEYIIVRPGSTYDRGTVLTAEPIDIPLKIRGEWL